MQTVRDQLVAHLKDVLHSNLKRALPGREAAATWRELRDRPDEWWLSDGLQGSPAEVTIWMLEGTQGIANLLRSMPWRIGHLPQARPLHATDNPLAGYLPPVRPWWDHGAFTSYQYFVPLSPNVMLKIGPWPPARRQDAPFIGSRDQRDFDPWEAEFAANVLSGTARQCAYGDARVVPQRQALKWLEKYGHVTVGEAMLITDFGPRPPWLRPRTAGRRRPAPKQGVSG